MTERLLKEKAEGAEGVSEGGFEAKEKPDDPEPKGAEPPREKAEGPEVEQVVGMEKVKPDAADDTGAFGTMLNGAAAEEVAGDGELEAAAGVRPRLGNAAGADGIEAAILGGWVAKEPVKEHKQTNKDYFYLISSHLKQCEFCLQAQATSLKKKKKKKSRKVKKHF